MANARKQKVKVTNDFHLKFLVEINENENAYVIMKQPSSNLIESILPALRTLQQNATQIPAEILLTDYKEIIGDSVPQDAIANFLRKVTQTSNVITEDAREIDFATFMNELKTKADYPDEILNLLEGTILFTSASLRYLPPARKRNILEDLISSPNLSEAIDSCKKELSDLRFQINESQAGA